MNVYHPPPPPDPLAAPYHPLPLLVTIARYTRSSRAVGYLLEILCELKDSDLSQVLPCPFLPVVRLSVRGGSDSDQPGNA